VTSLQAIIPRGFNYVVQCSTKHKTNGENRGIYEKEKKRTKKETNKVKEEKRTIHTSSTLRAYSI
jgi:hypothetical protein